MAGTLSSAARFPFDRYFRGGGTGPAGLVMAGPRF